MPEVQSQSARQLEVVSLLSLSPSRPLHVSFIAFSRGCVGGVVLLGEDENKIKSTLSLSLSLSSLAFWRKQTII